MTKFFETYCLSDVYKNIINNLRASCVNKVKRILPIFLITFFFIQVVSCGRTNKRSQSLYNLHEQCYWLIYHNDYDSLKQKAELFWIFLALRMTRMLSLMLIFALLPVSLLEEKPVKQRNI